MSVPSAAQLSTSTGTCRLRWQVLERRCHELGADNDTARGQLLGVTRHTILRWRRGHTGVSLRMALHVAQVIGVQLDQLVTTGEVADAA